MPLAFYSGWYSPELCRDFPDTIFVFGDNVRRYGMGGQAVIRSEPNIYGIATKRVGNMLPSSFFREGDENDRQRVEADLAGLRLLLEERKTCVVPIERASGAISLGLERAKLKEVAPSLYTLICDRIDKYADEFGRVSFASRLSKHG
jgi:hypothetical protein